MKMQYCYKTLKINSVNLVQKFYREGRCFKRILKELKENERLRDYEIEKIQNDKLRAIIKYCYENVPYYKDVFHKLKINPEDIKCKKDLSRIPIITKKDVADNFDKFISRKGNKFLSNTGYTSGTTGTPGKFLRDYYSINFESASLRRQWAWSGFGFNDRRVTIRGDLVKPLSDNTPPFGIHNFLNNQLIMSSYHLSEDNSKFYIEEILKFDPQVIQGYPSSVYLLAKFFRERGVHLKLKGVFTSSETLLSYQKELISEQFGCRVFDWYGNAERVVAVGSCEFGNYHEMPEYSMVEYISQSLLEKNEFEVVGTTFNNFLMPLIRYKTGDIVVLDESPERCNCGREFKIIKEIRGRADDYLILPDGRHIGRLDHIYKGVKNIAESQIIQENEKLVIIKVIKDTGYNLEDENNLMHKARERLGYSIEIRIDYVDNIPRNKNGKFKNVINKNVRRNDTLEQSWSNN